MKFSGPPALDELPSLDWIEDLNAREQEALGRDRKVEEAMQLLGIVCIQDCPGCGQKWVNLNDRTCRRCGFGLRHIDGEFVPVTN